MGVIKEGSISGVLPDASNFAVHYPGYPPSISRAIDTLGGIEGISKARSSDTNYLELRFRPEDPYSHPAFGEFHSTNGLLLKISKKKLKKGNTDSTSKDAVSSSEVNGKGTSTKSSEIVERPQASDGEIQQNEELCADIVAKVDASYTFDGMVDYQYVLAVHADVAKKKTHKHPDPRFEKGGLMDIEHDDVMMLVPPLFSLKDMPEQLVLRPSQNINAKKNQEKLVQQQWEKNITPCFGIDFKIKEVPQKINWEDKILKNSNDWLLQVVVSKLFEERPIWPRRTLQERLVDDGLKITNDQLKRILFRTAYYFGTGPYRTFWIRNGYDARKDPESRIYQRIDFRIPGPLRSLVDVTSKENDEVSWKDICNFKIVPHQIFSSLQLHDLQDNDIQDLIRRPAERTTCRQTTGWFSRRTFEILRLCVRLRFISLIPGDSAKAIVHLETRMLERSKRLYSSNGVTSDSDEDERHRHGDDNMVSSPENRNNKREEDITGESSRKQTSTIIDDDDDNDGEEKDDGEDDDVDEEEEDEEEEEEEEYMDDYHYSTIQGQRFESNILGDSYMEAEQSAPQNYLQQLLGKFPFTSNEVDITGKQLGGDSDGEYAIHEQESDDEDDD